MTTTGIASNANSHSDGAASAAAAVAASKSHLDDSPENVGVKTPQQQQQQQKPGQHSHHVSYSPSRFVSGGGEDHQIHQQHQAAPIKVRDFGDDVAQPDLFAQLGVDMLSISTEELAQRLVVPPSAQNPLVSSRMTTSGSQSSLTKSEHAHPDRVYDDDDPQQMVAAMHRRAVSMQDFTPSNFDDFEHGSLGATESADVSFIAHNHDQCWDMMDASSLFSGSSAASLRAGSASAAAAAAQQQQQAHHHSTMEAWLSQQDTVDDSQPSRHMWLGNLNPRLPRQALREVLQEYGALEDIVTFPGRMYAFANFRSAEDAQAVASHLANQVVPRLTARRKLIVRFRPSRKAVGRQVSDVVNAAKEEMDEIRGYDSPIDYQEAYSSSAPKTLSPTAMSLKQSSMAFSAPSYGFPDLPDDLNSPIGFTGAAASSEAAPTSSWTTAAMPPVAPGTPPQQVADAPTRHLWFGNIPPKPSRAAMEECFAMYGHVESLRVFPGKTYAFVNFFNSQDASRAKSHLDGVPIPSITGTKPMIIRFQAESSAAAAAARQESKNVTRVTSSGAMAGGGPGMSPLDSHDPAAAAQARAQAKLSNRLNPNNIYFDPVLAEQYKRMSKLEKELLWHFDRQNRNGYGQEPHHQPGSAYGSMQASQMGGITPGGFQQQFPPPHPLTPGMGSVTEPHSSGGYLDSSFDSPYDTHGRGSSSGGSLNGGGDAASRLPSGLGMGDMGVAMPAPLSLNSPDDLQAYMSNNSMSTDFLRDALSKLSVSEGGPGSSSSDAAAGSIGSPRGPASRLHYSAYLPEADRGVLDPMPSLNWAALGSMDGRGGAIPGLGPLHTPRDPSSGAQTGAADPQAPFQPQQQGSPIRASDSLLSGAGFNAAVMSGRASSSGPTGGPSSCNQLPLRQHSGYLPRAGFAGPYLH